MAAQKVIGDDILDGEIDVLRKVTCAFDPLENVELLDDSADEGAARVSSAATA